MCGIGGIFYLKDDQPDQEKLDLMCQALSRRGPDGHGVYTGASIGLVHTRLTIIDSEGGHQPMKDSRDRVIVFNGEIYNYLEIRASLKNEYPFRTNSDTETILALYDRYGLDFINHLRGMYAIALYDSALNRLVIARDPFGIKPLYMTQTNRYIAFASEPKALLESGLASSNLDMDVLRSVVTGHYIKGIHTPYPSVERVRAGEVIVFEQGQKISSTIRPSVSQNGPRICDEQSALQELDRILKDSVNLHSRSDVGYGVFLSGGVDSSSLMQVLSGLNKDGPVIKSYTAYFDVDGSADERNYARHVATATEASFHEVPFGEEDFKTLLPQIATYMDDPVADYAVLPTWKLAAVAAREQKVVLCGEGGDELFAGYGRYRKRWWKNLSKFRDSTPLIRSPHWSRLQREQAKDICEYLPNDLLIKLDTCLMANGLEGRTPFLDSAVADFAFTLPDHLKLQNKTGKYILKKWLDTRLPESKPFRKKQGFTVPVGTWMAANAKPLSEALTDNNFIKDLLSQSDLSLIPKLLVSAEGAKQCWPILYLALWHAGKTSQQKNGDVLTMIQET